MIFYLNSIPETGFVYPKCMVFGADRSRVLCTAIHMALLKLLYVQGPSTVHVSKLIAFSLSGSEIQ